MGITPWPKARRKVLSFKDEKCKENKWFLTRGEAENPGSKNNQESILTASTLGGRGLGGKEPEERGRKEMRLNDPVSPKFALS